MDFPITFNPQSKSPLHRQLYEEIRRAILSGRLAPGQRMPSTRQLAQSLAISRTTVVMTYDYLLSEGYLQAATGSGTFVCRNLPDDLLKPAPGPTSDSDSGQCSVRQPMAKEISAYGQRLENNRWFDYDPQEPQIQFSFGRPALDHFPTRQWLQLLSQNLKRKDLCCLDCPSKAQGYDGLRQAIADYLKRARAVNCDKDQVIIVNGSQQALDLLSRVIVNEGDAVGIENPGYIGAQKAFQGQGATLVPLRVDGSGLVVDALHHIKDHLRLLYVTPSHQFPTGVVLSLPRRLELLAFARKARTLIIEDDYDSEYRYAGRPIPALAGLDQSSSVVYVGTFSKVLFPALRLGYMVVPPHLVEVLSRAKWLSDRHSALLDQQVLADFIAQGHLERHIRRMRALYERRRAIICQSLQDCLGDKVTILGESAGINVLVRFLSDMNDEAIVIGARQRGIGLTSTRHFYLSGAPEGEFLLNYGNIAEEDLREGVRRLADVVLESRSCLKVGSASPLVTASLTLPQA